MPRWVDEAFNEYRSRLRRSWVLELAELTPSPRTRGRTTAQILDEEAAVVQREWTGHWVRVALDERGQAWDTAEFAKRLEGWRDEARDVAFAIGSADGLAASVRNNANVIFSLSSLTLPHGLVRVVLAEQVYRAMSILEGHPYHRQG